MAYTKLPFMLKLSKAINLTNTSLFFLGLMFLLPFINLHHQLPIPSFYSEWIAGVLGLMAIFSLLSFDEWHKNRASTDQVNLRIPQISIIFIGLAAILCMQWLLGMLHSIQYALLVLSYFIWAFFLTILGSNLRHKVGWETLVNVLAWCMVIAGIINIGIVVLQFVVRTGGVIPFLPNFVNYGALAQLNHIGNFCALAITSLIYLYAKGRFSISLFYLVLVLFMMMLSFSGSRSAWLHLIALAILLTVMHRQHIKQGKKTEVTRAAWRAGLLLLPTFIAVQLFIYFFVPSEYVNLPTERIINGMISQTPSARLQFWYDSWRIFLQSPLLGVGSGQLLNNTFLLIDSPTAMASKRTFEHAHNLFLHLLAEMGITSFLFILICLISWLKAFKWRNLNLETWWIISLLSIIGIHSMLEYPLWFTFFLGVAVVLLGAGEENFITIKTSDHSVKIARIGLIAAYIFGTYTITTALIANVKLENWIEKIGFENINDSAQLDWVEKYSLLSPYGELMRARSIDIDIKHVDSQFLLNESVMSFKPMRTIAYQHALLLELKGQHEDAVKQLDRTIKAYPDTFKSFLENPELKFRQEYLNLYAETQTARLNKKN